LLHRSQIGHCNNQESYKNQQNLQKAMDQARKLVNNTPTPNGSRRSSPIPFPETTASSLKELLKDITKQSGEGTSSDSSINRAPLKEGMAVNLNVVC
jgi:transient-receptor-potential-like protein